jgi:type IV pilus secretin PilQ/predicted competence protein
MEEQDNMNKKFIIIFLVLFTSVCFAQQDYELVNIIPYQSSVTVMCSLQPSYNKFYLDNPPRVAVDFKNCVLKFDKEVISVESSYIQRVRVKQFKTEPIKIVRVVLDLYKKYDYEIKTDSTNLVINLVVQKPKLKVTEVPKETKALEEEKITEVEVKKSTETQISKPITEKVEQISSQQPSSQQLELAISSPQVTTLSPPRVSKPQPVSEKTKKEEQKAEEKKFVLPKTPVTLECVDADIQDVLQMLAVKSGVNIIYGPDVTGKITISLKNVPFDKAFENILRISKLVYVIAGDNIVRVGTPQVIEQERSLQVMYTKIFPLNYAVADDVKTYLEQILKAEGRTKGMISVDKRTNSLIVTESEEGLNYIEEWIKKLDTKPYQVTIEAQVIDISVDDLSELGVQWGIRSVDKQAGGEVSYSLDSVSGGGVTVKAVESTAKEIQSAVFSAPTGVPLESATFLFGKFTDSLAISARLATLITQGKAKVLSNPRVTTVNNKTATIIAGEKIPYKTAVTQTTTGAGMGQTIQEQWEYISAGIQLTVTPTVSPDGWITLTIKPQVDIPQISAPGVPPTVKSRQTEVTVMVKNNEPLVIGGLISDSDIEAIKKLPVLGDLPILGYLFKYKTTQKKRTELIILITPRIVEE